MCKCFRMFGCFLCAVMMMFAAVFPVAATSNLKDQGFVEYQVDASINFEEVIEVKLQNQETGETYTHQLYRVNDYAANFSVPFGVYIVSAQVLSMNSGQIVSDAVATCLTELVVVESDSIAVPLKIRIDEFTAGDVSETYDPAGGLEEWPIETTVPSYSQDEDAEMTAPNDAHGPEKELSNGSGSVLVSLVFSLGLIGVAGAVVWYKKKR